MQGWPASVARLLRWRVPFDRSSLWIAIAALLGCGVDRDETQLASIDSPHPARLIGVHVHGSKLECAGGHGFGLCFPESVDRQWVDLETEGPRARTRSVNCDRKADSHALQWGPAGKRLAFRCGDQWRVADLVGPSLFDREVESFDPDAADAWAGIETFAQVADSQWTDITAYRLIAGFADDAGPAAALDFTLRHVDTMSDEDAQRAFADVDDPFAAEIYVEFRRRALLEAPSDAHVRLFPRLDREAPPIDAKEIPAARKQLAASDRPELQLWLLGELRRTSEGPAAACDWIAAQEPASWRTLDPASVALALAAVVEGEEDCPALVAFLEPPCHEDFVQVDEQGNVVPFSDADIDEYVSAFASESFHGAHRTKGLEIDEGIALAALRRRSGSPEIGQRLDRLGYGVDARGRRCNSIDARNAACSIPASALTGRWGPCEVIVDDDAKTIVAKDVSADTVD